MKYKLTILFFMLIVSLIVINWGLISYGWMQGKGQLKILLRSQPIEEILNNPNLQDSLRSKILLVGAVKKFALEKGFESTDNYSTYYDQNGEVALWNLSACEPYSFTPYEWSFPFLGTFSYKGFFDLEKAKIARQELIDMDYDTRIRSVSAWSTLGWFRDPIMSNMLRRSAGDLAETILHELTHATVFFKDSIEFNENLASFIGENATKEFLQAEYGDSSAELTQYLKENRDSELFRGHIFRGKDVLDSLYQSFSIDQADRDSLKNSMIRQIVDNLDSIQFHDPDYYSLFEKLLPNNAYFMSFQRYHSSQQELQVIFESQNSDIGTFLNFMKTQSSNN